MWEARIDVRRLDAPLPSRPRRFGGIHEEEAMSETIAVPEMLLDVRSGELVEATPARAAEFIIAAREMRNRLLNVVKDCEAVLLDESRRQGTKTLRLAEGVATITGGSEWDWDIDRLTELLVYGLPAERFSELVVETVSYKVDARVAKQLEAANETYAAVIRSARTYVEKPWRVSVR
jgi:hypothetical protein